MITLVLGGARSGKSAVAERLAGRAGEPVTYVATMRIGDDPDLASRVESHRARRPPAWRTEDAGDDLPALLRKLEGTVLLDGLGAWVAGRGEERIDPAELCAALEEREGDSIVVSEEVGLGVHPSTETGRHFRDVLGMFNQAVAQVADDVLFTVAGRVLHLDPVCPASPDRPGEESGRRRRRTN